MHALRPDSHNTYHISMLPLVQIYVHAHPGLRDDMQEWAAALAALMDASRPTAAAFIADFVAKVCGCHASCTIVAHVNCTSW